MELAASRLLPGDVFSTPGFAELSHLMNRTVDAAAGGDPSRISMLVRRNAQESFVELDPWRYGMSISVAAAGRRMLGISYRDPGEGLIPGDTYDYRIGGYFRRGDLAETFYGFHTVPRGTELPEVFYLRDLRFSCKDPLCIETFPGVDKNATEWFGRKGLRLRDQTLSIELPNPLTRLILELEPAGEHLLDYSAFEWLGVFPNRVADGPVPHGRRVELTFPKPVSLVCLSGWAFLYGVRTTTLDPADDPEEIVPDYITIPAIKYERTPLPDPPPQLGTDHLQHPLLTGDPEETVKTPLNNMGFRLTWFPPGQLTTWPPDFPGAPPFEAGTFEIERRRVDTNSEFGPLEPGQEEQAPLLVAADRSSRTEPGPVFLGADLLALYPEKRPATPPVNPWMELEDVLWTPGHPQGPPPGSTHQYRISTVDIIGRHSANPTLGSIVMLEKHLPPPQPCAPVKPPPPDIVQPRGVRARVIQANDPGRVPPGEMPASVMHASDDDLKKSFPDEVRACLDGATDAIVLEWGWTDRERTNDPFATEFRVYIQGTPPDIVTGALAQQAVWNGSTYELKATFSQEIAADAFAGQYVNAGGYPFRVAGHTGGSGGTATLYLEPSRLNPALAPGAGKQFLTPALKGSEGRPAAWGARVHCEPIAARTDYAYVFLNVFSGQLQPTAANPSVRVWVGVSAADNQGYIKDELKTGPWGGRPGNESHIVAVSAVACYFGRPELIGQRPLFDIPETTLDEVNGPVVTHAMDVPG
jgi:hypothetical protein